MVKKPTVFRAQGSPQSGPRRITEVPEKVVQTQMCPRLIVLFHESILLAASILGSSLVFSVSEGTINSPRATSNFHGCILV